MASLRALCTSLSGLFKQEPKREAKQTVKRIEKFRDIEKLHYNPSIVSEVKREPDRQISDSLPGSLRSFADFEHPRFEIELSWINKQNFDPNRHPEKIIVLGCESVLMSRRKKCLLNPKMLRKILDKAAENNFLVVISTAAMKVSEEKPKDPIVNVFNALRQLDKKGIIPLVYFTNWWSSEKRYLLLHLEKLFQMRRENIVCVDLEKRLIDWCKTNGFIGNQADSSNQYILDLKKQVGLHARVPGRDEKLQEPTVWFHHPY